MAIDGFLELFKESGETVEGEAQDAVFANMIELNTFTMDATRDMKESDSDTELPEEDNRLVLGDGLTLNLSSDRDNMSNSAPGSSVSESFTVEITKEVDLATTELFSNYCYARAKQAMPYEKAVFYFRIAGIGKSAGKEPEDVAFLIIEFTKPYVYSYKQDTRSTSIPEETVGFYFQSFTMKYKPQTTTGKLAEPAEVSHALGFEDEGL
jgi:type VI protein secretion system component Hcp